MRLVSRIVFASMNPDKYREFQAILRAYPEIDLIPAEGLIRNADKLGLAEIHDTYIENAAAKARLANQGCHYPTLADDSGLEVEALNGKPGVHSKRFAKPSSTARPYSKREQAEANMNLMLSELAKTPGVSRRARFVTTVALNVEGLLVHATGTLEGTIVDAPRGENGFGYDPIFVPEGSQKTLAEMTEGEKNAISHRARAIQSLMTEIKTSGIVLAKP